VIGAGLAGLVAADALARHGRAVTVVEARPWIGGRTMTMKPAELGPGAWLDMGATWHWEDQPRVRALAAELGMPVFPQFRTGRVVAEDMPGTTPSLLDLPPPSPAELRFRGGAQDLCERLAARLAAAGGEVRLETTVVAIEDEPAHGHVAVSAVDPEDRGLDLHAPHVIVAAPPRLVLENIPFTPELPADLEDVMRLTPTWMATALKCVAVYEAPFWRADGLAGTAFSEIGPLGEVHDASTDDGSVAALWGFVSPLHEFRDLSFDDRIEQVFAQLGRLFGPTAADPVRYYERDWSNDPLTNDETPYTGRPLLEYGHPSFAAPLWGGRLHWAGTETAQGEGSGHMEGAVASGQRAARAVLGP